MEPTLISHLVEERQHRLEPVPPRVRLKAPEAVRWVAKVNHPMRGSTELKHGQAGRQQQRAHPKVVVQDVRQVREEGVEDGGTPAKEKEERKESLQQKVHITFYHFAFYSLLEHNK